MIPPAAISNQALVEQAKEFARSFNLDPALVCAVIEQESGWDVHALRYEDGFFSRYIVPLGLPSTEARARAFSWGLMQIMGQTARELGFKGAMPQLCDPFFGISYGCRKLATCLKAVGSEHDALVRYNGGSNPAYADQVLARVPKYMTVQ
jgi:soluble lytic murein transglycosylase-like protein